MDPLVADEVEVAIFYPEFESYPKFSVVGCVKEYESRMQEFRSDGVNHLFISY